MCKIDLTFMFFRHNVARIGKNIALKRTAGENFAVLCIKTVKIGYFTKNRYPGVGNLGKNLGPGVGNLCQNFCPGGTKSPPLPE